jgi:hypothetical protein
MIVMPANQTNELVHLWAGRYPGSLGHLFTPARKDRVRPWLPYALDNGRFAEAVNGIPFNESGFITHLERYAWLEQKPLWVVVPDVPFDGIETLKWWDIWEPRLRGFNIPLAIAVQDGMSVSDVLSIGPDVVFVGGTTDWKWKTVADWANAFPRVHVGRVNSPSKLYELNSLGVESCDGSGWFRGKSPQVVALASFLATVNSADREMAEHEAKSTRLRFNFSEQQVFNLEMTN